MYFEKIELKYFRNYSTAQAHFSNGLNVFVGKNGQGKTNLLEAILLCSGNPSFRVFSNQTMIQQEKDAALLKTVISNMAFSNDVSIQIQKEKRSNFIDGKKVTSQKLVEKLPIVIFSPESLSYIKDGPDKKRLLIDEISILIDSNFYALKADFQKCLQNRNKLLREIQEFGQNRERQALLESINQIFFDLSSRVTQKRIQNLEKILPEINEITQEILGKKDVEISVDYVISSQKFKITDYTQIFNAHLQRASELSMAEIGSGTSLVGAHKHEINILYCGNDSRYYCSQGQQRALILAFKIAQIVYHRKAKEFAPILLLDDVLSELDEEKQHYLIAFLQKHIGQVFMTTADVDLPKKISGKPAELFFIEQGHITKS